MMLAKSLQSAAGNAAGEATYIEDVFSTYLYTGNSATQTITNGIDLAGEGGLVWTSYRAGTNPVSNWVIDSERGNTKYLRTNAVNGEATTSELSGFNSNGYTLSGGTELDYFDNTYVSWTFRKQPKFFDVVTFSTNASSGTDSPVAHALASTPGCIIIKSLSTGNWFVWHRAMNATTPNRYRAILNSTFQAVDEGAEWIVPTSTSFNIPNSVGTLGASQTYVAYLFAHDAGGFGDDGTDNVISCGSFTSNSDGSASVTLGYEPQFLLYKRTDSTGDWALLDTMRGFSQSAGALLRANLSDAEQVVSGDYWNPTATGFIGEPGTFGVSTQNIYIAIRRGPMKTPTSGAEVFAPVATSGSTGTTHTIGFPLDLQMSNYRTGSFTYVSDRLRGVDSTTNETAYPFLKTSTTDAETTSLAFTRNVNNTSFQTPSFFDGTTQIYWNFRRAPGFFDVVCYTGTGSARTVAHNLGVAPELMIVKARSISGFWYVFVSSLGADRVILLNSNGIGASSSSYWNSTMPTSTVFSLNDVTAMNGAGSTFVAYLFASCHGVSKCGSYTGTGTTQQINCGFTAGARFVLIKRADSTGDWYVWDSARGIVAGDDPYLLLNSTAAEVTNTDYVDTYSAGFEISSTAPAEINANGGTFIYLAIA